jgi:3-dehydroquinate dehydratase II
VNRRPKKLLKILIANGVNLDLLGVREPHIYGSDTLDDMKKLLRLFIVKWKKKAVNPAIDLVFFQTNSEEKFLMEIGKGYAGAIINAGAWTHTSLAIADRLKGVGLPYVEVHVSNLKKRENFRQKSFLKDNAVAVVSGMGIKGYEVGLIKLLGRLFEQ